MSTTPELHAPGALPEGEEPPPPGVKIMVWVRWLLILALAGVATYAVLDGLKLLPSQSAGAHAARYHCPMHPQVVSDRPGSCPICGMDLVLIEEAPPQAAFHCPMHPQVVSDHPGSCPLCGMDLVPVEKAEKPPAHAPESAVPGLSTLELHADRVQRIGVRTARAAVLSLEDTVRSVGILVPNESRTAQVHARFSGWIEELMVRETGAAVKRGDPLVAIYSPEVLQAQQDLVVALQTGAESIRTQLLQAARARLHLLGLSDEVLAELESKGRVQRTITLRSPQDGYVTQKTAVDGLYIAPGTTLFQVSDLSVVWMLVDVREDQMARVRVGQKVDVEMPALPGTRFTGKLTYLYPTVDTRTRTLKARVELGNPNRVLRPGMYGNVTITLAPAKGITIPAEAAVQTGTQTYVFVARGEGVFEPREVKLGVQTPERVEVLSGVQEGEEVVTSALFMLDSESRLRSALDKGSAGRSTEHAPHGGQP